MKISLAFPCPLAYRIFHLNISMLFTLREKGKLLITDVDCAFTPMFPFFWLNQFNFNSREWMSGCTKNNLKIFPPENIFQICSNGEDIKILLYLRCIWETFLKRRNGKDCSRS